MDPSPLISNSTGRYIYTSLQLYPYVSLHLPTSPILWISDCNSVYHNLPTAIFVSTVLSLLLFFLCFSFSLAKYIRSRKRIPLNARAVSPPKRYLACQQLPWLQLECGGYCPLCSRVTVVGFLSTWPPCWFHDRRSGRSRVRSPSRHPWSF